MTENRQPPSQERKPPAGQAPAGQAAAGQNQGEGNREAAADFNRAEREFVDSPRGQQKIREGTHVAPDEEAELSEAEQRAGQRAKAQDSNRM